MRGDLEEAKRTQRAVDVALAALMVGACGWLVFDLLPALKLVAELLRG